MLGIKLKEFLSQLVFNLSQWRIRDFSNAREWAPTYYLAKLLSKTAWKWKKLDWEGGVCTWHNPRPLNPPLYHSLIELWSCGLHSTNSHELKSGRFQLQPPAINVPQFIVCGESYFLISSSKSRQIYVESQYLGISSSTCNWICWHTGPHVWESWNRNKSSCRLLESCQHHGRQRSQTETVAWLLSTQHS